MSRSAMTRRLAVLESRSTDVRSLTDEELDARIAAVAGKLLQTCPASELRETFATMPAALAVLGLTEGEPSHAPY